MIEAINRRAWVAHAAAVLSGVALAGCATSGSAVSSPGGEKELLLKRVEAYWTLVRTNDKLGAWAYEAQSKDPKGSLEGYMKRGGITYDAVEVREVRSIEGDKAVVDVFMRYSVPLIRIKAQEAVLQDEWQRIDGVWYHVLRRSVMFPSVK
jgi:hypothetical protein